MLIKIVAVGKMKDAAYKQLCDQYWQRLRNYTSCDLIELKDTKFSRNRPEHVAKKQEAEQILKVTQSDNRICLDVQGSAWSSEALAAFLQQQQNQARRELQFVIGGPVGLDSSLLQDAMRNWSLSPLTFPHEMARTIVLEQLYRAFTILRGESYHK